MIKDFIVLTKFVLSFAVSLSALFAYMMAKGEAGTDMFIATFAVLLVAMGVSTLNQVQEYKEDALMDRTKHRPIASGKISPTTGLIIAAILVLLSLVLIYDLIGMTGVNLFLFSFIWYNLFYTPLKKKSALAVVPGAILGVIPPAVGWLTAGSSLNEIEFYALGIFYFVWQVPHFWLLAMLHDNSYKSAGYPTPMNLFGKEALKRLTFVWLILTMFSGLYLVDAFTPVTTTINILLLINLAFALVSSFALLKRNFQIKDTKILFMKINTAFLLTIILLTVNEVLKHS